VVALFAAAILSCGSPPSADVVARIDDDVVTAGEVRSYLAVNLDDEWGEEALSEEELDLVRSRLFDAFLEERILLHEADRRGIEASDEEARSFLRAGEHPGEPGEATPAGEATAASAIETARRSLRIQKLIDRTARGNAEIGDEEIEAWIRQRGGPAGTAAGRVVVRSLLLPSAKDAERAWDEIRRRRMTFDEAVALHEQTPGQASPTELSVDDLPPEVRAAIAEVGEGRVAPPVEVAGEVFLFQVVRRGAGRDPADVEAERARAVRELQEHRTLQASRRLLESLREELDIRVFPENLPFRYVPDEGAG